MKKRKVEKWIITALYLVFSSFCSVLPCLTCLLDKHLYSWLRAVLWTPRCIINVKVESDYAANAVPSALKNIFKANLGHTWFSLLEMFLNCSAKENALGHLLIDIPVSCLSWGVWVCWRGGAESHRVWWWGVTVVEERNPKKVIFLGLRYISKTTKKTIYLKHMTNCAPFQRRKLFLFSSLQ